MIVVAALGFVVATGVFVLREWWWLRRVERASGDPEALDRLLGKRRWSR